jgi:hypothetical protein
VLDENKKPIQGKVASNVYFAIDGVPDPDFFPGDIVTSSTMF